MNPPDWVLSLPAVNASLNATAAVLLLTGYTLIRRRQEKAHEYTMYAAFAVSILFLGSYLIYHYHVPSKHYPGTGPLRTTYLLILLTHIVLAAAVPFLALMTIYRALRGQWKRHRRIAKITLPIWLYVSVTGVIIYLMLYVWPPGGA